MKTIHYLLSLMLLIPLCLWADNSTGDSSQKYYYKEKISNYWYHWNPDGTMTSADVSNGWSAIVFDIQAPRDRFTIKDGPWNSYICQTLVGNYVKIGGKSKYYFAPKGDIKIKAQNGKEYTITPQNTSYYEARSVMGTPIDYCNGDTYNKLFSRDGESFLWDEATLEQTLNDNTIIYSAGAFGNTILFAECDGVYTPIARITQQEQNTADPSSYSYAGNIELIHWLPIGTTAADFHAGYAEENTVLYDVLNAIGYPNLSADGSDYSNCDYDHSMKNINRQLRAWIGYVKDDGNNVAQYVEQQKYDDDNKATFLVSWQRPINLYVNDPEPIKTDVQYLYLLSEPIKTAEQYLYLIDYLRLYDWRGDKWGYMYDDNYWFWAFYNVKEIDIDLSPEKVMTNLHQQDANTWVPLSNVSTPIQLRPIQVEGDGELVISQDNQKQYSFDFAERYNSASMNAALLELMGISTQNPVNKARFGGIYYNGNGEYDETFCIQVPITVKYEWGSVTAMMKINVGNASKGDANGDDTTDAADVVDVINHIINPSGTFDSKAADMNDDNAINIADIIQIINIIFSQQ